MKNKKLGDFCTIWQNVKGTIGLQEQKTNIYLLVNNRTAVTNIIFFHVCP